MKFAKISRITACVVGAFLALSILAGIFLAEATLHPARRAVLPEDETRARKIAVQNNSDLSEVSISAVDGATLHAWSLHPRDGNGNAVAVFHGLSDNRSGMLAYAEIFLHHGYDVLLPDARAHGASEGAFATYGIMEADDTRRWLAWIESHEHPACVYGFAESMGATRPLPRSFFYGRDALPLGRSIPMHGKISGQSG